MKVGKLDPANLEDLVLHRLPVLSDDIVCGPATGLDCAAIRFKDGLAVLSTDPITGASADIGSLAIHVSCNDLAAFGIRPKGILLVLIAPPWATAEDVAAVIEQASQTAEKLGVSIAGGHTEVSDAVTRFIVTTTAIGFAETGHMVQSDGGQPGDALLMTKTGGLEGTAILAADQKGRLEKVLSEKDLSEARDLIAQISVVPEGIIGGQMGVHAMHDATEGGILGAAWEMAQACGLGLEIEIDAIPLHPLTRQITTELGLDPYRLISSGSLLIATDRPGDVQKTLAEAGVLCSKIGRLTESVQYVQIDSGIVSELAPPGPDELYKIT
ncbi:MAG: AIR synthase family protein [Eubacteriales bacterium]|nr:AIR synthase family protein [Eubacteriales bacterium]